MQLSDIQASPEELQDYYAQLRAQHVTRPGLAAASVPSHAARPCPTYGAGAICGRRLCEPPSWLEPSRPNDGFCA